MQIDTPVLTIYSFFWRGGGGGERLGGIIENRPFYRYGGHLEFRGNYGMPRGQMRNN